MIIIKRLSILLAFVVLVSAFTGCTKPVDAEQANAFSIYRINDNVQFTLGDKREDIDKIIDDVPSFRIEMEDETPEEHIYWLEKYDDITLGYDRAGNVLSLRLHDNTWKIANGLKVTDSIEDVKKNYSEKQMHTFNQSNDIYVSYDNDGNLIDFDSKSPYLLRFVIEDYAIKEIVILNNINPLF